METIHACCHQFRAGHEHIEHSVRRRPLFHLFNSEQVTVTFASIDLAAQSAGRGVECNPVLTTAGRNVTPRKSSHFCPAVPRPPLREAWPLAPMPGATACCLFGSAAGDGPVFL